MNTALPISTISFNTTGFLEEKLESLVKSGKLEFWAYVHHYPEHENDDGNGKEHNHLYVKPAIRMQTEGLRFTLQEHDPKCPTKPLGCLPFMTTKHFGDWYLYALHDAKYLKFKGQTREYHYKPDDVKTSDRDALNWYVRQIDLQEVAPLQSMVDAIGMGMKFNEYFMLGKIPIQQLKQAHEAWHIVMSELHGRKVSRETQNDNDANNVSDEKGNQQSNGD